MRRWLLLALLTVIAAPSGAASAPSVLGGDGEIYRLLRGEHRQLIPNAPAATASNPVLVLEIVRVGGQAERQVVPGSENEAVENYPALALDHGSNSLFVVWEAQFTIHSTLHLVAFSAGDWSDVFELSGDPFSAKYNPQLAVTTDRFQQLDDSGAVVTGTRTLLHLVWHDESALGNRALYEALRVEHGAFVPDWTVLSLPDLLPPSTAAAVTLPEGLYRSPQVRTTSDGASVLVAFGEMASGRLGALEIRPVSPSLTDLARKARGQIIDMGHSVTDRRALAEKVRLPIVDIGRKLMGREVATFLADRAAELIASSSTLESLEALAERVEMQMIDMGAQLARGPRVIEKGRAQIVDLGYDGEGRPSLRAALKVGSARQVPQGIDRNARLLLSDDGEDLVLAWDLEGAVEYRQSENESWSDKRALTLNDHLTRDDAYQLLTKRLRQK